MVAIYVTKQWVKNIGAAADLILVETDMKGDFAILMAAEKSIDASSPFVHANALRRPSTVTAGKSRSFQLRFLRVRLRPFLTFQRRIPRRWALSRYGCPRFQFANRLAPDLARIADRRVAGFDSHSESPTCRRTRRSPTIGAAVTINEPI